MSTLYIANKNYSSWSLRPWILMRALAIPFKEKLEFFLEGSCWDKFRTFSPNGLVPCLHDGDLVIWESLGIVEYLAERHDGVWPEDVEARAWARCATSEMHAGFSALRNECPMNCGVRVELDSVSPALLKNLVRLDELWSEGLSRFGGPYLAGNVFTAVDAFFAPVAFRIQTYHLELGDAAMAYAQRLLNLEAMQDWYDAALKETWRETEHDRESFAAGKLIADLRESQVTGAETMINILYLCTGNSCRSQIAEGWTRHLGGGSIEVQSAGIEAHGKNPRAISIMQEAGIDISGQESTIVSQKMLELADVVVTVCGHADEMCPALPPSVKKVHWPLSDPAKATGTETEIMDQFRATRIDIEKRVRELLEGLAKG